MSQIVYRTYPKKCSRIAQKLTGIQKGPIM